MLVGFVKQNPIFTDNVLWASGENEIQRVGASRVSRYVQQQKGRSSLCKAMNRYAFQSGCVKNVLKL